MEVSNILEALKERALWTEARKIIVRSGLKAGKGWPKTLSRYAGADVMQETADALASGLAEHVLAGEKALRLYRLAEEEIAALREFAIAQVVPDTPYSQAFPCKVEGASDLGKSDSVLCASYNDGDGTFLVYSGVRRFEVKEKLDLSKLDQSVVDALGAFSTLYGTKLVERQLFDVLWIPLGGNIVFSIVDSPKGMPPEFLAVAHSKLRKVIRDGVDYYPDPIDLFDAILGIYKSDWGTVVELGFLTDTGSVKYEHMKIECLRQEPFHVGGKDAVDGVIHPFSVTVRWPEKEGELEWEPELMLHSSALVAQSPAPSLYDAFYRSAIIVRDLKRLRRKISEVLEDQTA